MFQKIILNIVLFSVLYSQTQGSTSASTEYSSDDLGCETPVAYDDSGSKGDDDSKVSKGSKGDDDTGSKCDDDDSKVSKGCGCDDNNIINDPGCQYIDGGGWQLVRHVSCNSPSRQHPATDNAKGSQSYGTYDGNAQSPNDWSIRYDNIPFNQYLFAFGDCSTWLVTTTDAVYGEFYENSPRCILQSSETDGKVPYYAKWYYRNQNSEDPWVSTIDHFPAITNQKIVYGENGYQAQHYLGYANHGGGNVWIRNKNYETRYCKC